MRRLKDSGRSTWFVGDISKVSLIGLGLIDSGLMDRVLMDRVLMDVMKIFVELFSSDEWNVCFE
jgi:hypothetical protein